MRCQVNTFLILGLKRVSCISSSDNFEEDDMYREMVDSELQSSPRDLNWIWGNDSECSIPIIIADNQGTDFCVKLSYRLQ